MIQPKITCLLVSCVQHEAAVRHDDLANRLEQLREQLAALETRVGYNPALTAGAVPGHGQYGTSMAAGGGSSAYQRLTLTATGAVYGSGSRPGSAGMMAPGMGAAAPGSVLSGLGGSSVLMGSPRGAAAAALTAQVTVGMRVSVQQRQLE
jgi:hypothetical protein